MHRELVPLLALENPAHAHLHACQVVYEYMLRFIVSNEVRAKVMLFGVKCDFGKCDFGGTIRTKPVPRSKADANLALTHTNVRPSLQSSRKYLHKSFCKRLILLFKSGDPRERDYLKTILHRCVVAHRGSGITLHLPTWTQTNTCVYAMISMCAESTASSRDTAV